MSHDDEVAAVRASLIGRPRDTYKSRRPRPQIPSEETVQAACRVSDARAWMEKSRADGGVTAEEAAAELSAAKYALAVAVRADQQAMRDARS